MWALFDQNDVHSPYNLGLLEQSPFLTFLNQMESGPGAWTFPPCHSGAPCCFSRVPDGCGFQTQDILTLWHILSLPCVIGPSHCTGAPGHTSAWAAWALTAEATAGSSPQLSGCSSGAHRHGHPRGGLGGLPSPTEFPSFSGFLQGSDEPQPFPSSFGGVPASFFVWPDAPAQTWVGGVCSGWF